MLRTMTGFGSSCGACKFLRRKCTSDCVFSPYFSYDQARCNPFFSIVHKVYGASVLVMCPGYYHIFLSNLEVMLPSPYLTKHWLACRILYIYGCVAHIYGLQQQVANLQEEINILGSTLIMANSTVDVLNCDSVQAPMNSNNGIHYLLQNDATRTQYYQNQLANLLSHEGSATVYNQSFDSVMDIELPNAHGRQEPLFGDSNSNPLEKFLSGIDQEVFMNHPWFKHNVAMN